MVLRPDKLCPDLSNGGYDLSYRTANGTSFQSNTISGNNNTLVIPSGRGFTFSPASLTSFAGATNVNFTITASPPAIGLPASVTMNEDTTFFGTASVADLEQAATALTITTTYSDNPQLINSDGIYFNDSANFTHIHGSSLCCFSCRNCF